MRCYGCPVPTYRLYPLEGAGERVGALPLEEHARLPVDHRIQRASASVGYHRPAGGGRFQGGDAKIGFLRENERLAAFEVASLGGVVYLTQELDGRAGQTLQARPISSFPDNLQRRAQPDTRLDGEVDPLIGDQARND